MGKKNCAEFAERAESTECTQEIEEAQMKNRALICRVLSVWCGPHGFGSGVGGNGE